MAFVSSPSPETSWTPPKTGPGAAFRNVIP
jgi:hypothetical protein